MKSDTYIGKFIVTSIDFLRIDCRTGRDLLRRQTYRRRRGLALGARSSSSLLSLAAGEIDTRTGEGPLQFQNTWTCLKVYNLNMALSVFD